MTYDFQFNEPIPCPFILNHCQDAVTLSLWFRWVEGSKNKYQTFIQLGSAFRLYKAHYLESQIRFRWISRDSKSWFNFLLPGENKWHHLAAIWRATHTTMYMDGRQRKRKSVIKWPKVPFSTEVMFGSSSKTATFSTSPMYLWNESKSPAFIWRLYQDGLPKFRNWILHFGNSVIEFHTGVISIKMVMLIDISCTDHWIKSSGDHLYLLLEAHLFHIPSSSAARNDLIHHLVALTHQWLFCFQ